MSRVYNERVYTLSHEACLVTFYDKPGFLRTIINRIPTGMNHQQGSTKDTGSDGGWNLIGVLFRHLSTDQKICYPDKIEYTPINKVGVQKYVM